LDSSEIERTRIPGHNALSLRRAGKRYLCTDVSGTRITAGLRTQPKSEIFSLAILIQNGSFIASNFGVMIAVKLAVPIVVPPLALRGAANAWIKGVPRIQVLVVIDQSRLCVVQMAEVVLSWELRATRV
jgi:hypothetical protein